MLDDLEVRMNRAAEAATPRARALFVNAIRDMSIQDAQSILNGPDDAATRYFESRMREPWARRCAPSWTRPSRMPAPCACTMT